MNTSLETPSNCPNSFIRRARSVLSQTLILALMAFATSTHAAVLVNDTWKDGTRTDPASPTYSENGTDGDADGNLESAWFQGGSGVMTVETNPPSADQLLRSTVVGTSSASWTTYFTPDASPVTLSSEGDKLKITWVFTLSGVNSSNTSQGVRMGIVDSPNAARISSDASPGSSTYAGYGMNINMGTMFNHSSPFQLLERSDTNTSSAFLSSSGSWSSLATVGSKGQEGYLDSTEYTYVFTATLQSGGALEVVSTMSGGNIGGTGLLSVSSVDATPNSLVFDTFGIRPAQEAQSASTFNTSLFKAEFIPGGVCNNAEVTSDPSDVSAEVGDPASFLISAGNSTSPTYRWQVSVNGGTTWNDDFAGTGYDTANYSFASVGLSQNNYQYRCIVDVACGSTSSATSQVATLTVSCNTAGITSDPVSTSADAGQTANFSVTATGSSPTYQWEYSPDTGSSWFQVFNGSGGATDSYTTDTLTTGENGYQYRCIVSVACDSSSLTSAVATLTVNCNTVGISASPVDKAVPEGLTAGFSVTASGSAPSYQWELSTDGGSFWSPVGGNNASYTTPATTLADSGNKYRCIVSVVCDGSSVTSSVATLTVVGSDVSFRSAASGAWSDPATWELSANNGASWFTAGIAPNSANSTNILISSGTTVTITNADATVDQTVVAAGGTLVIGANKKLIIADGADTDVTVFGTVNNISTSGSALTLNDNASLVIASGGVLVEDGTSSGWISAGTGSSITFASGGKFQLVKTGGRIPVATWDPNSTCEIAYTVNGSRPDSAYLGQTFGHFTVNCPSNTSGWDFAGNLTSVLGDLTVTLGAASADVELKLFSGSTNSGNLTVVGDLTMNTGRLNIASSGGPWSITLGGDLTIAAGAKLDVSGSSGASYTLILNSGGTQQYTCNGINIATKLNWTVNSGTTFNLNNDLPLSQGDRTLTVDGTVNLNGNTIVADLLAGSGTIRNQGGGSGLLVLGAGNGNNTVGTLPSLLNGTSGTLGLGKSGSGSLTITDAQSFGGGLVVSNGTALVNNVSGSGTGNGAVTVVDGTLGGNGSISGSVTVEGAGNLAPGNSIEDLTISGVLTLNGTFTAEVNTGASPNTDRVLGASARNYGGTLEISNQGAALTTSDTFQIFPAGTRSGAFGGIVPANPDGNISLAWDTSTMTSDGTLRIVNAGSTPTPVNITFTKINSTQLELSWPPGQGWKLEAQTNNSRAVGLSNNWVEIIGADTPYTNNVSPATPTTFFRLVYP